MMQKKILVVAAVVLAVVVFVPPSARAAADAGEGWVNSLEPGGAKARLVLVEGGRARYAIVLPREATPQQRTAGADLRGWLGRVAGAAFEVVAETDVPPAEGRRAIRLAGGEGLGNEGYAVEVEGEELVLRGGRTRGMLNAVY